MHRWLSQWVTAKYLWSTLLSGCTVKPNVSTKQGRGKWMWAFYVHSGKKISPHVAWVVYAHTNVTKQTSDLQKLHPKHKSKEEHSCLLKRKSPRRTAWIRSHREKEQYECMSTVTNLAGLALPGSILLAHSTTVHMSSPDGHISLSYPCLN